LSRGIHKTNIFLVRFLENALLGENNELKNRTMHIQFKEQDWHVHKKTENQSTENVGELSENCRRIVGELSDRQKQIIRLIAENNTISAKRISEILKTSDRTIERDIRKLIEIKCLERIGADRGGFWQIINH
jgi:predicted HTH transcriptional regulator